jgi:hypothetical protein
MSENLPLDELHHNAGLTGIFYNIFDPAYIWVVQRRCDLGFGVALPAG